MAADRTLADAGEWATVWQRSLDVAGIGQLEEIARICPVLGPEIETEKGRRVHTVVGTGQTGFDGDNLPAVAAILNSPCDVVFGPRGDLYIADCENHRIRKVDGNGVITTVAGTGRAGFDGDDQPAVRARLDSPCAVAFDAHGNLHIAETRGNRVRRVDGNGVITTVAGTGQAGFWGDDHLAVRARLDSPCAVAFDAHGNLHIVSGNRVRRVDGNGVITTVAGTGQAGFDGDSQPAVQARLNHPCGIDFGPTGDLHIADTSNHRVRRVDGNGVITTVAGTGQAGFNGDNQPAVQAQLFYPSSLAFAPDGALCIVDTTNRRLRTMGRDGILTTFAGNGASAASPDGARPTCTALGCPEAVAFAPDGSLYAVENETSAGSTTSRIRRFPQ
ncbi:hypothetical protein ACFYPT_38870 [Streptomyces sp. NPDC005529]|uniref:NHL domain-containing protein n=1 Tax=unclassified Streptomyces TaxID=2593676 RepID=UPI0033A112D9